MKGSSQSPELSPVVVRKSRKQLNKTRQYFDSASYQMNGEIAPVYPKLFEEQSSNQTKPQPIPTESTPNSMGQIRKQRKETKSRCYFDSASYQLSGQLDPIHPRLFASCEQKQQQQQPPQESNLNPRE